MAKKITTVEQIVDLAREGKSVLHTLKKKHVPAAWLQNYQAVRLVGIVRAGYLEEYEPKRKSKAVQSEA